MKHFTKIILAVCVQRYTKEFRHITIYGWNSFYCILKCLDYITRNEISIHLYFLLPMYDKVFLGDQNFEMKILMDLHVLSRFESKNGIFSVWSMCVCFSVWLCRLCMCVCMCAFVISIMQKQIISETPNLIFLTFNYMQMLLETFYEDRTNSMCSGLHKRIIIHYGPAF